MVAGDDAVGDSGMAAHVDPATGSAGSALLVILQFVFFVDTSARVLFGRGASGEEGHAEEGDDSKFYGLRFFHQCSARYYAFWRGELQVTTGFSAGLVI